MIDEAVEYLKEATIEHATTSSDFHRGAAWGAFQVLVKMGFEDAALEAIREVEEGEAPKWKRVKSNEELMALVMLDP